MVPVELAWQARFIKAGYCAIKVSMAVSRSVCVEAPLEKDESNSKQEVAGGVLGDGLFDFWRGMMNEAKMVMREMVVRPTIKRQLQPMTLPRLRIGAVRRFRKLEAFSVALTKAFLDEREGVRRFFIRPTFLIETRVKMPPPAAPMAPPMRAPTGPAATPRVAPKAPPRPAPAAVRPVLNSLAGNDLDLKLGLLRLMRA